MNKIDKPYKNSKKIFGATELKLKSYDYKTYNKRFGSEVSTNLPLATVDAVDIVEDDIDKTS